MSNENGKIHASAAKFSRGGLVTVPNKMTKIQYEPNLAQATPTKYTGMQLTNGLARLAPARDLTLGGRGLGGITKKVFTPNLNAVRNKNANVKTSKEINARGGRRGKGDRGGGRGSGNSTLIQTTGVFSEGAGGLNTRKSSSGVSYSREKDDQRIPQMRKPVLTETDKNNDSKTEAEHMLAFFEETDDEDDLNDLDSDIGPNPVRLSEGNWKLVKPILEIPVSTFNCSSLETVTNDDNETIFMAKHLQTLHVKQEDSELQSGNTYYPATVEEFLKNEQSQIFLMQLPDTLPCLVDDSLTSNDKDVDPTASTPTTEQPSVKRRTNVLNQMEEGRVGKLIRYKSGKTKLVLGATHFELNIGIETGFLQELMSISTNRDERSGNMINLGPIQAKINATPDWQQLFEPQELSTMYGRKSNLRLT